MFQTIIHNAIPYFGAANIVFVYHEAASLTNFMGIVHRLPMSISWLNLSLHGMLACDLDRA